MRLATATALMTSMMTVMMTVMTVTRLTMFTRLLAAALALVMQLVLLVLLVLLLHHARHKLLQVPPAVTVSLAAAAKLTVPLEQTATAKTRTMILGRLSLLQRRLARLMRWTRCSASGRMPSSPQAAPARKHRRRRQVPPPAVPRLLAAQQATAS